MSEDSQGGKKGKAAKKDKEREERKRKRGEADAADKQRKRNKLLEVRPSTVWITTLRFLPVVLSLPSQDRGPMPGVWRCSPGHVCARLM